MPDPAHVTEPAEDLDEIVRAIVAREGGWVNDPDDPGGATNHGITEATFRRWGSDLDGDGQRTRADLRRLSADGAAEILLRRYYHDPGLDRLPPMLQATVFDMQVNAGTMAVKLLQRLLTDMGFPCADDGQVGPRTVGAAQAAAVAAPEHLADAYGIARRNHYYRLADARPASRKYARRRDGGKGGWIARAEEFIAPRYRLTHAQHRARTARWG